VGKKREAREEADPTAMGSKSKKEGNKEGVHVQPEEKVGGENVRRKGWKNHVSVKRTIRN